MKQKIVGFIPMSKRKGKVVFILIEKPNEKIIGMSTDKLFLYDDLSDKISNSSIGKEIEVIYTRGYNGSAVASDVIIE